jgi:hypothetical protein
MRAFPIVVLLVLALAGCVEEPRPSTKAASSDGLDAPSPSSPPTTATAVTATDTPVPLALAFAYEGKAPTGACAFAGSLTGTCQFTDAGKDRFRELPAGGKPVRLDGVVTYTQQVPQTVFYIYVCAKEGNAIYCRDKAASGPSPLKFTWDLAKFDANATVILGADNEQGAFAQVAGAYAFTPADFKVNGVLTRMP